MAKLQNIEVLQCVAEAIAPQSAYIAQEVRVRRRAQYAGRVSAAEILRRLRLLESNGLIVRTGGPNGFYGYSWSITEAGRLALAQEAEG